MSVYYDHNPIVTPTVRVEEVAGGWLVWYVVPRPDCAHPIVVFGKICKKEIDDNIADWGTRTFEILLAHTLKYIMAKVVWIQMHQPELGRDGKPVDAAPGPARQVRQVRAPRGD